MLQCGCEAGSCEVCYSYKVVVRLVAVRYVIVWEVLRCARPVSDSVAPVVAPGEPGLAVRPAHQH